MDSDGVSDVAYRVNNIELSI